MSEAAAEIPQEAPETEQVAEKTPEQQPEQQSQSEQTQVEKTEGQTQASDKTQEEKPVEPEVPEAYDFGEEIPVDPKFVEAMTPVFKEAGLTNDKAQLLAQKYNEFTRQIMESWANETKADQEIGGDALEANVAVATKALETFGTPELRELLDASGLGNHKEVIRFFYKVGKMVSEDNPGRGNAPGAKKDRVSILYPDS